MSYFAQALINGIALGGMYTILVLGFSVIWGVMGVINLAHGEFVMVGAYLAWVANDVWHVDPFVSAPAVFVVMVAFGYVTQKLLVNRVIGRSSLVSLLVMFGVSIILQSAMKLVSSADFRRANTGLDGAWRLADQLTIPVTRFWVLIVAVSVAGALSLFVRAPGSARASVLRRRTARRRGSWASTSRRCTPSRSPSASGSPAWPERWSARCWRCSRSRARR